jgi:hypothetical protein
VQYETVPTAIKEELRNYNNSDCKKAYDNSSYNQENKKNFKGINMLYHRKSTSIAQI